MGAASTGTATSGRRPVTQALDRVAKKHHKRPLPSFISDELVGKAVAKGHPEEHLRRRRGRTGGCGRALAAVRAEAWVGAVMGFAVMGAAVMGDGDVTTLQGGGSLLVWS